MAAGNTTFDVPYGYVFDPTSGLFYNEQVRLLWWLLLIASHLPSFVSPFASLGLSHPNDSASFLFALFCHTQAGMFFDHTSGYYAAGGKWYTVNEAGEFVEYSGA